MKDLRNIIKTELKNTNGELIYKEQLFLILNQSEIKTDDIYSFIKYHIKNREEHLIELKSILSKKGYSEEDINYFINNINNRNLIDKCHLDVLNQ